MKLEIKHLAGYLPYRLRVIDGWGDSVEMDYDHLNRNYPLRVIPILRPLSDLTRNINWGLQSYEFTSLFEIGDMDGFIYEFSHGNIKLLEDLSAIAKYNSHNDINYLPYPVVQMMLEHHFDIFGLIDQGLAININHL